MEASETRTCPRCGRLNEADATNCIRCGLDFSQEWEEGPGPDAEAAAHCYKHPKVPTNLSCGRCERPICTRCAVIGPNGVRCKECARQNVEFRPGAVVHEVKRGFGSLLRMNPFMLWILISLIGSLVFTFRSCSMPRDPHGDRPEVEREAPPEE